MTQIIYEDLSKTLYVRSKISYYPLSHVIRPIPEGLVVVLFRNRDEIQQYFVMRGITDPENFEITNTQSVFDLMEDVSNMGYLGFWYFNNYPVFFGNYISDIDIDLPSFVYTQDNVFIGATGLIDKPINYLPWRNYNRTDKLLAKRTSCVDKAPFDFSKKVFFIRNSKLDYTNSMLAFNDASPLQGPYVSTDGATALFTEREYAERFLQRYGNSIKDLVIEEICLDDFLAIYSYHMIDIGINPGCERFMQGYFLRTLIRDHIKTIYGIYKIGKDKKLYPADDIISSEIYNDTIERPNTLDPSLRGFATTIKYPLKSILGSTKGSLSRREAKITIDKLLLKNKYLSKENLVENADNTVFVNSNKLSVESFAVFAFDKIIGIPFSNNEDDVSPYIFDDIVDAILYFYFRLLPLEHELRLDGFRTCSGIGENGSGDLIKEDIFKKDNESALVELLEKIFTEGYKIEHAELLMSYINRISKSLEIEACGYLGDLAFFKGDYIDELKSTYDSLEQDDMPKIHTQLFKVVQSFVSKRNSKIELDDKYQNSIHLALGNSYDNLSMESRVIIESALRQFKNTKSIINYDYAGISMKLCKSFERELKNQVFDKWRVFLKQKEDQLVSKSDMIHLLSSPDRTLSIVAAFVSKNAKIELGPMRFILKRCQENPDHVLLENLKSYISQLNNSNYLLSSDVVDHCDLITKRYRNGGVHEKIVSYAVCEEAFENILLNNKNYLSRLLSF